MIDRLAERLGRAAMAEGRELGRRAFTAGLSVTSPNGSVRPISISCVPVILDTAERHRRAELASTLAAASVKAAQWAIGAGRTEVLFALSPLERSLAIEQRGRALALATLRLDCLVADNAGHLSALEVNATIPAMQGYSDIAAESLIGLLGERAGLLPAAVEALQRQNGSNARALFQALLQGHRRLKGGEPRSLAILCRRNDSQTGELRFLARRFSAWGLPAELAHPDELTFGERVSVRGQPVDLIYRHLFVRRLETEPTPLELRAFYAGRLSTETVLLNPPASQVEAKSTFALLSSAADDDALSAAIGLTPGERQAVRSSVPWTRLLRAGPAVGSEGEPVDELVAQVAAEPFRYVIKRAWGYGGSSVFLGPDADAAPEVKAEWARLCRERAAESAGGYVVQQRVPLQRARHWLCTPETVTEAELYVDYSAYASVGLDSASEWSGVCRGAPSPIVNIAGGGGLVPLLDREVASQLLEP